MIFGKYKIVGQQVALLLCLFALTRLLFLIFNYNYFAHIKSVITPFIYAVRFDLVVICWLNGLLFILVLLPFKFIDSNFFKISYRIVFIVLNALALLCNCIDTGYFEFIQKRSTFDLFQTLGNENNGVQLLPQYISDYWYVLLRWIGLILSMLFFTRNKAEKVFLGILNQR
jgi:hypothetical protein